MSSDSATNMVDSPLAEASRQAIRPAEDQILSLPASGIPHTDKPVSSLEMLQDDSAISTPSPHLFFPLSAPVAGKSGIKLFQLLAEAGNTMTTPPDIATAEMVVAGKL